MTSVPRTPGRVLSEQASPLRSPTSPFSPTAFSTTAGQAPDHTGRVRRGLAVPYWVQVAQIIAADIAAGRWSPGEELPSEAELCATHDVSRTAVRQALGELAHRGLVSKERGRRTIVTRSRVTNLVVQELRGFYDEISEQGGSVTSAILRQEIVPAPPAVADELEILSTSRVVVLTRLRFVDGRPVVHVHTWLPASRFATLASMNISDGSLYAILEAEFGVRPSSGSRMIEAVQTPDDVAHSLQVEPLSPALKLSAVNRDDAGVPFELFEAHYRGDETRFELIVGS